MIEIIKRGTKTKITCKECGCLFSYEEEDIEIEKSNPYSGYTVPKRKIKCPQCEIIIILEQLK